MWETKFCRASEGSRVIAWDLDSSVRSTMQRRHLVPLIRDGKATWDQYSMLAADDVPVEGAVALMRMFSGMGFYNFAVSGASADALSITDDWAKRHDVPLDDYLLRPDDTPNGEWKIACVRRLRAAGLVVELFVEDYGPVAAGIREHTGVPVLGVNPFDEGTFLLSRADLREAMSRAGGHGCGHCGTDCADGVIRWLEGKLNL